MQPEICLSQVILPDILGTACLTTRAFRGENLDALERDVAALPHPAARSHDAAILEHLRFRRPAGLARQSDALALSRAFRVRADILGRLRVLAVMLPGDLMANTPLDFMLVEQDVRLDLFYHRSGHSAACDVPDHDVAVFAASDSDPAGCAELQALFDRWPRPAINAPSAVLRLARDVLSCDLACIPGLCSPRARRVPRPELAAALQADVPLLVRPLGSHAGQALAKIDAVADLRAYLDTVDALHSFVTPFVDYRSADGRFRKWRVAFIDRAPFLCHMAISDHWMIHYLNAGMTEDAAKRVEEARAMAIFDTEFAGRHAAAFAALNDVIGLDYFTIDCAELPDGRLLLFEADNAAIVHLMDPPDLFPYKRPHMQRIFKAFFDMLQRRAHCA